MSKVYIPFNAVIDDVTKLAKKIEKSNYLEVGKYPIIDQSKSEIAGYAQDKEGLYENSPVIIFGDHTRIIKYVDTSCFIGADGVKLLKVKSAYIEEFDYKFLYYFFSYQNIPDTGYNRHFKWLKAIDIYKPSIEKQLQIATTLDKASELITLRKKQLEELDALAESVFYDMFGDPVKNEKGWKIGKMIDFSEITSSKRIFANEYTSEGIPFYRSKEIAELGAKLDISIELFISKDRFQDIKQEFGIPQKGDILIAAIGATIGKMWVVDTDEDFYFKDGNIIWIKNKGFVATFLRRVLLSMITTIKEKLANGGAYPALTIITLKDMDVILPPIDLQTRFASIIKKIEQQKALAKKALQESEDLFQRLMQDLFKPD